MACVGIRCTEGQTRKGEVTGWGIIRLEGWGMLRLGGREGEEMKGMSGEGNVVWLGEIR